MPAVETMSSTLFALALTGWPLSSDWLVSKPEGASFFIESSRPSVKVPKSAGFGTSAKLLKQDPNFDGSSGKPDPHEPES